MQAAHKMHNVKGGSEIWDLGKGHALVRSTLQDPRSDPQRHLEESGGKAAADDDRPERLVAPVLVDEHGEEHASDEMEQNVGKIGLRRTGWYGVG